MRVSLSLWSMDQARIADEVERYGPLVDSFHVDVADGVFADNLLFGPLAVQTLRRLTGLPIVVHLMVARPDRWVSRFADAGADVLAVHPCVCPDFPSTVDAIRTAGARPGAAIRLDEPAAPAFDVLDALAVVLVMATAVGVKGRAFDPAALQTVRALRDARAAGTRGAGPELYVDGGIRRSSVADIAAAGADGVVAGSLVTSADDPAAAVGALAALGGVPRCA
jgi:ribulose-phosphate 3-epimerase